MKKKQKQNIVLAGIAVAIIGSIAGYSYSAEQTRQMGFIFGNELLLIQESVREHQGEFSSKITQLEEKDITKQEFVNFSKTHFEKMNETIAKYDTLTAPGAFEASVSIFKLSAESQLESDKEYALWVQTGDNSHRIRSDALIQESFEYETAALGEFNRAKLGIEGP